MIWKEVNLSKLLTVIAIIMLLMTIKACEQTIILKIEGVELKEKKKQLKDTINEQKRRIPREQSI